MVERARLRHRVEVGAGARARERAREVDRRAPALKTIAAAASISQLSRRRPAGGRAGVGGTINGEADVVVVVEVEVSRDRI